MVHCCSEEEARMKIYSVSTRHYYAFGALVSEELSYKIKGDDISKHFGFFLSFCRSNVLASLFCNCRIAQGSMGPSRFIFGCQGKKLWR